jgi:non-specific serine/threonine protein kinase
MVTAPPDGRPPRAVAVGNIPAEVDTFVGRERELARLRELLFDTRLLTLVGPGGVGKTRLAMRLESQVADEFPDGIWLVDLSPIADPALVPQAFGDVLGVRQQSGQSMLGELRRRLRAGRMLLVLDNCEHLLAACAELVGGLLPACPNLQVLATSLQPLGAPGETTWRVQPLSIPDVATQEVDALRDSEAVRLFVARVQSHWPDFTFGEGNARDVAEICRRLDGLPLSLELVAARVESLGIAGVAARLGRRFELATGNNLSAPPRHRSLQATLNWSCGLLSQPELILLRRLAVFVGGWTLDAAEAVCSDDALPAPDVVDVLSQLVTRSLVVADHDGLTVRYRLLETVRAHAYGRLAAAAETQWLHRRHATFMLQLAEPAFPSLVDTEVAATLEREEDNLRAALPVSQTAWPARSSASTIDGLLLVMLGDYPSAEVRGRLALEDQQARGDVALQRGDLAEADRLHTEAARQMRDSGHPAEIGSLLQLGQIACELGQADRARRLIAESEAIGRARHDPVALAAAMHLRGAVATADGAVALAAQLLEQALAVRGAGQQGTVKSLTLLGHVRLDLGQHPRAHGSFAEAMRRTRASGERLWLIRALEGCARWLAASDEEAAVRLAAATDAERQSLGTVPWPSERRYLASWLGRARRELGASVFERAWEDGHASSLAQAVALAEALTVQPEVAASLTARLTPREQEVAVLLASGLTNKQIAGNLVVSPATVRSHVEHILVKLDLRSRAQVAVWASQQGLV